MTAVLFITYLVVLFTGYCLKYLNLSYLKAKGGTVPPEFEGVIDPAVLKNITAYTIETSRLAVVESIAVNAVQIVFLFGGIIGYYDRWVASLAGSSFLQGALFFLLLLYAGTVLDIPFSLYRHFNLENRYGFNTMTLKTWLSDLFKSLSLSTTLGAAVIVAALAIVQASPGIWWFWVWLFFLAFGIFMMYVSPYAIEPLFFKFKPLSVEGLEERIRSLMERAGLAVGKVLQVDASRRSRHSNAYFTGIGRVKRIVLFDTLLDQMGQDEVLAVLAHEVGHWKKRHVLKRLLMSEVMAFTGLFLAYHLTAWDGLPRLLGMQQASFYAKVVIVGFLGSLVLFPLTPVFNFLSRRDEREADRFAAKLTGRPEALASALVKLSKENLSNLHPHPLYAAVYYSHPPAVKRIRNLRGQAPGAPGNRD